MKTLKRTLGLLLAVCVLAMSLPLSALAAAPAYSDTEGHWAEAVIEKWSEYDVVHGDDGKFRPNAAMTRGEFATVMSNLLGLEEKSENPFRDVTGKEWYANAVLKAHAAGILLGDDKGNSNATAKIQRQEAFVMVGRALGVVPATNTSGALTGFNDKGRVSGWAQPMVAALVKGGYVNGTTPTTLAPAENINRASVIQLVGATVKTYVTEPGAYTAEKDGFVVVNTPGSVTVSGDNAGVVVGAGSKGAKVTVSSAQIKDGAKVDAPNAVVTLDNANIGGVVTVSPSAKNAEIVVPAGTTVDKIVTQADSVTVSGDGQVKAVEVAAGDKVNVATPGTAVTVDKDAGSGVTVGGKPVKPGESSTTPGSGQGYEEGSGDDGPVVPPTPKYTIQYYVNGTLKETKTVPQSDTAMLPALTAPTVDGYTFVNTWYLDEPCATTTCDAAKPIKELLGEGGGTTLKLYIKGTPITYTVAFNGNGSDGGSMSNMTSVAYNTADTLTANGFTKTGHTFLGWATSAGGQKAYDDGAPAKELTKENNATVTLYAVWQPNTYTVTYKANEGTGSDVTASFTYGSSVTLTQGDDCTFTRTGYHFNGWNTAADGSGTAHAGGSTYNAADNLTLYAQWDVNRYTISFDGNGATGGSTADNTNVAYNVQVNLTTNGYERTGYTFQGWAASANGPKVYDDQAQVTGLTAEDDGAVTLYAVWEINKYTVTFDWKGGDGVEGEGIVEGQLKNVEHGSTIAAPTVLGKAGHTFKGWYKEYDESSDTYTTPWSFTDDKVTEDVTLYAKWDINTYTVTFDTDGGSAVEAQSVEYNGNATSPVTDPTKEGYTFSGWVTEKGGDAEFDFTNTAITDNTTVYAKWTPVQHTVTYNGNGSDGGTAPEQQVWTYGQEEEFVAAQPGDLTKSGSTFVSWNTAADGSGKTYLPGDSIVPTEDITLYALWITAGTDGTITFNGNGSDDGTMANQTYAAAAESLALTANAFTRNGYSFAGWSRNQDGTGTRYENGATITGNPGTITLYAQWVMDVTLRLSESDMLASNGIPYLQENDMLTLKAAADTSLTYKAAGTAKHVPYFREYFANTDGDKYSKDNAAVIQDGMEDTVNANYDCSGNFLVFDIVDESGKYDNSKTTVSVQQNDNAEIVANEKITFSEVEGKQTAAVAVKLNETRTTGGINVVVDWDGNDGANAAVTYKLDVSEVTSQPAAQDEHTLSAYDNLETDTTVVGQTKGGVDLHPADLAKSLEIADNGETVRATLKYVTDTAAEEGPGYYLAFQVNSPEMGTQPDGLVKLCLNYNWGTDQMDEPSEQNYRVPTLVLQGSDFVKNGTRYTATAVCKVDPDKYDPDRLLAVSTAWMSDNTWNEYSRPYGVQLTFMPRNSAALMATWDGNASGADHWPFLFDVTDYEHGGRTAQDLFVAGSEDPDENFEITEQNQQPEDQNATVYNASGYLRFVEDFPGYANDRYPGEKPDFAQDKGPGENWRAAASGWYIPVDIVNVQGADVTNAEAKVYNGPVNNGGQLIYTVQASAFDRTVQTGSGAGYPNSATFVQNLQNPDGSEWNDPLFIVVDWDTTDPNNTVETLVLDLGIQRQLPSRAQITAEDRREDVTYGEGLEVNQDENFITGTLIYTEPKKAGDTGYYLPLTFTPQNPNATLSADAEWVMEYRFAVENEEPVVLGGADFAANRTAAVLLPVPQAVVDDPMGKGLEIRADWDGRDFGPGGTNTGHLAHGETGMWLDLSQLQFQSQYHLVSAHSRADETGLETVPENNQTRTYDYVQWPDGSDPDARPQKQTATVTMDSAKYEYQGKRANELVGGDFRITSDDGETYYALGMVKYTDSFNSYWYNHAPETFFYNGPTNGFDQEHWAKVQLRNAGFITPQEFQVWLESHNNAASFGYYIVFDLEKGGLTDGKIEIWDTAVSSSAAARVINAADFGANDKLPVVYQLKTKDEVAPGATPFANELTIKYFNASGADTADKEVTLAFEKTVGEAPDVGTETLHPQPVSDVLVRNLVVDGANQVDMELQPSQGPGDVTEPIREWKLTGGITPSEGTPPYNLTLNLAALAPTEWPKVWDPEQNQEVEISDETVVVHIHCDPNAGDPLDINVTKGNLKDTDWSCVIEGVRRLNGLSIDFNWAGFDNEDWASRYVYVGLYDLFYREGAAPTYNEAEMGTVIPSKNVIATTETVTVGETEITETGAKGTPNAFGIVDVSIAYDNLYPRMTGLGEMVDYFGSFSLKAPEGATAVCRRGDSGGNTYQLIKEFSELVKNNPERLYPMMLYCTGEKEQTVGVSIPQIGIDQPYTCAVQWYSGGPTEENSEAPYTPMGAPVYYRITATANSRQTLTETDSYLDLYTGTGFGREVNPSEQPALNEDGTWLYLDGSYNAGTKTWTPQNWQPLKLVSSEDPTYAEAYYVELDLLAPSALAEATGMDADTVLCTVTGGTMTSEEKIELKKSALKTGEKWGTPCAWLHVIVPVAAADANTSGHGANVTFNVDWDGADGTAYTPTEYTLDLSNVALGGAIPAPEPAP